jgi:predicted nucleotidyltransferase
MNQVSQAGLAIARRIAAVYRTNPNVQAVMLSGSVARGYADHYSDLEIGVFWATPPTDADRTNLIRQIGGDLWSLTSYTTDPEWVVGEHYGLSTVAINGRTQAGLVMVDTKHATLACLGRCFRDVLEQFDTALPKQILIAAVQDGIPLYGDAFLAEWQARAKEYPDRLAIKMIQENLWCGPWFVPRAYVERDDQLVLYQHVIWMQQSILKILAGLNRCYYRSAEHKWMNALIARFTLVPPNLAARLKQVFHEPLPEGMRQMLELVHETVALVAQHCPEVDRIAMFAEHPEITTSWARRRWEPPTPYTLLQAVGNVLTDTPGTG